MRRFPIPPLFLGLSLVVIILGSLLLPTGLPAAIAQGLGETETPTPTFTETATLTETATATLTVTETTTPSSTPTVTETALISATASLTATPSATVTSAPIETATVTPTATSGASPTVTPTVMHQQFLPVVMQRWDLGFQPGLGFGGVDERLRLVHRQIDLAAGCLARIDQPGDRFRTRGPGECGLAVARLLGRAAGDQDAERRRSNAATDERVASDERAGTGLRTSCGLGCEHVRLLTVSWWDSDYSPEAVVSTHSYLQVRRSTNS